MMVEAKSGAIFNVSSFGGKSYLFDVAYGIGKAAVSNTQYTTFRLLYYFKLH